MNTVFPVFESTAIPESLSYWSLPLVWGAGPSCRASATTAQSWPTAFPTWDINSGPFPSLLSKDGPFSFSNLAKRGSLSQGSLSPNLPSTAETGPSAQRSSSSVSPTLRANLGLGNVGRRNGLCIRSAGGYSTLTSDPKGHVRCPFVPHIPN